MAGTQPIAGSEIVSTILGFYPETIAVYLFGSYGTEYENADSDVDLAVLLPHARAKGVGALSFSPCADALAGILGRPIDLINLREADTVLQTRIIETGRLLHGEEKTETAEFEMLTLSFYQKLNEERAGILEDIVKTGRVFAK